MGMRVEKQARYPEKNGVVGMRAEKVSVIPREECCSGYESVKSKRDTQSRML